MTVSRLNQFRKTSDRSAYSRMWRVAVVLPMLCLMPLMAQDEQRRQNVGQQNKRQPTESGRNAASAGTPDATTVMRFAEEHHPELGKLLRQLKQAESPEFERAIRELSQQVARIERLRERAPTRFQTELEAWKVDSKIKLLVARWAMSQDPALERQIRALLKRRQTARIQNLTKEKERLQQRLKLVNEQIAELKTEPAVRVDSEFTRLTRKANATRSSRASRGSTTGRRNEAADQRKPADPKSNAGDPAKNNKPSQVQGL